MMHVTFVLIERIDKILVLTRDTITQGCVGVAQ